MTTNYLGRGIHKEKVLQSLKNGHLKKMLDIINDDNSLDIQLRNDYLNIYYNGGNIAKVNSENSIEFDMFYFYLGRIPKKTIKNDTEITTILKVKKDSLVQKFKKEKKYKDYFAEAKEAMNVWLKINPKPERMEQHNLSINNKYNQSDYTIIDLEYQVSTNSSFDCKYIPEKNKNPKKPRFDIIAINKKGEICVIELKKGTKSLKNTSGLKEHWICYRESIARKGEAFVDEMRQLLKQKQDLNLISAQLKIESSTPKFMFAYSYDEKMTPSEQDKTFQTEYEKIGEEIHVIKLKKGSFKLLD